MCMSIHQMLKEELENTQTRSKQILQKQTKKLKNVGKMLDQIQVRRTCDQSVLSIESTIWINTDRYISLCLKQDEARRAEDYCEAVVVSVIESLQKHYLSVRELIGAQEEVAAAQVHTSVRTLMEKMEEMKEREAELDRLAQTDNDVRFLQVQWSHLYLWTIDDVSVPVSLTPTLSPRRNGRHCSVSVKKTTSTFSTKRIHSSPLGLQRELLNNWGSSWRRFVRKNLP